MYDIYTISELDVPSLTVYHSLESWTLNPNFGSYIAGVYQPQYVIILTNSSSNDLATLFAT